jgi:hypothetical protein
MTARDMYHPHTQFVCSKCLPFLGQAQTPKEIEDVVCQTGDQKAVLIRSLVRTAHMAEPKFILGFLDKILHVATFAIQSDDFLGFILLVGHDERAGRKKLARALRFAELNFVYHPALLAPLFQNLEMVG